MKMVVDIMPYALLFAGSLGVGLFAPEIIRKSVSRHNKSFGISTALEGAEVHCPPNVSGKIASISAWSQDPKKKLVVIALQDGTTTQRVVDPKHNIKPYNLTDMLLDKTKAVFVINIDDDGEVVDNFMGLDFTPRSVMNELELKEMEIKKLQLMGEEFVRSPIDKERFMAEMEMFGKATQNISPERKTPPPAPLMTITNEQPQEGDE